MIEGSQIGSAIELFLGFRSKSNPPKFGKMLGCQDGYRIPSGCVEQPDRKIYAARKNSKPIQGIKSTQHPLRISGDPKPILTGPNRSTRALKNIHTSIDPITADRSANFLGSDETNSQSVRLKARSYNGAQEQRLPWRKTFEQIFASSQPWPSLE